MRRLYVVFLMLIVSVAANGQVTIQHGRTLSELIANLYGGNGIQLKDTGHQAHFGESSDFQSFSNTLQAVLQSRPVFPVPSTAGLVSYRFNEQTGTYDRVEGSLGPVLAELGATTGRGSLNVSLTHTFADIDRVAGQDTIDLVLRHCLLPQCVSNVASPFLLDTVHVQMRFRLKSQAVALSTVYGVSDRLDVGMVIPYIRNDLSVFTHAGIVVNPAATAPSPHQFDLNVETPDQLGTGTAIGIGDVVMRAKLRVAPKASFAAAVLADLALPTGEKKNFLGTGHTRLKVTAIASRTMRQFTPHANLAYEVRFGQTELDAFDYRLGTDALVTPKLTLAADMIGVVRPRGSGLFENAALDGQELVGRSEIDGVLGAKWRLSENRAFILNLLTPLNATGIRPRYIMTAGLQFGL